MPYKICRVYRYEFFSQKCKSFTTLVILYTQQVCFTMGRNSLYYFLYGRVCYQTSRLLVSLQRMESNLRKLFILLLSLLTLLFVWHILLCWNKNVNNHCYCSKTGDILGVLSLKYRQFFKKYLRDVIGQKSEIEPPKYRQF